jgi:UDP-N-acetylglucosamine transferase subunit ALG13
METHKINAVISDNRYGLFNEAIYSVFITHQLLIKTSLGNAADEALQKLNYEYVNAFDECWVPDVAGLPNLSGDLSHPQKMPAIPVHYPGALSRMKRGKLNGGRHLLILLSGPEPQRTQLEELLITQLERYKDPVVFVRGLPGDTDLPPVPENVYAVNHLSAPEMQEAMEEASFVVSRCGYSTIMDIMVLRKRSILIPTPGQTEQEYLAQHLMQQNGALCIPQSKFKLMNALELAGSFNYKEGNFEDAPALQTTVRNFVEKLRANDVVNEPV